MALRQAAPGQDRRRHVRMDRDGDPGAARRRGAGADPHAVARSRQPRLDDGQDLSRCAGAGPGDERLRHRRGGRVQDGRAQGRRYRRGRLGLAGLRRGAGTASCQAHDASAAGTPDRAAQRHRAHRLFRPARSGPAQARRHGAGLGRCRRGGNDGRPDRQARRLSRRRHGGRAGQVRLAHARARFRCGGRLQGRRRAPCAGGSLPERHRRLFRQYRRRRARRGAVADEPARPHRLLRQRLAIRRREARTRADGGAGPRGHQAPAHGRLHCHGFLRPPRRRRSATGALGRRGQDQGRGRYRRRPRQGARSADRPVRRQEPRQDGGQSSKSCAGGAPGASSA